MTELKPGEIKILKTLIESGNLNYGDIKDKTRLSNRAVSVYLNALQIKGFVERVVVTKRNKKGKETKTLTRNYRIIPISVVSLFFKDIIVFMQEHLEKTIDKDLEKGVSFLDLPENVGPGWIVVTDHPKLRQGISEKMKQNPKIQARLLKISSMVEDSWESHFLENAVTPNERVFIDKYRSCLLEIEKIVNLFYSKKMLSKDGKIFEDCKKSAKEKLEKAYPGVEISEKMIQIDAEKMMKRKKMMYDNFWQPETIDALGRDINERLSKFHFLRDESDLTSEENKRVEELAVFLGKNRRRYEGFLARLKNNRPKTLLMYPSIEFSGYGFAFKKMKKEILESDMSDFWKTFSLAHPLNDKIKDDDLFLHGTSSKRYSKIKSSGYLLTELPNRVQQISQPKGICFERIPKDGYILDVINKYAKSACEQDGSLTGIILQINGANLKKLGCPIYPDGNKHIVTIRGPTGIPISVDVNSRYLSIIVDKDVPVEYLTLFKEIPLDELD